MSAKYYFGSNLSLQFKSSKIERRWRGILMYAESDPVR